MVVSPLLRGLFGLQTDAGSHRISMSPHVPADWTWFTIDNVHVGTASLRLAYRKSVGEISLTVTRGGNGDCSSGLLARSEPAGADCRGGNERQASAISNQEE